MADKYGRLFTEADVRRLVDDMAGGDEDRKHFRHLLQEALGAQSAFLTFPADEPLFLLRAKDWVALAGVYGYAEGCDMDGRVDDEQREAVQVAIRQFSEFAALNPERMKVPD